MRLKAIKINDEELQADQIIKYIGQAYKVYKVGMMGAVIVPFTKNLRDKKFASLEEESNYMSGMFGLTIISARSEVHIFGKHLSNIKKAKSR